MTYKQLTAEIALLSPEQQNADISVYIRGVDEFYPTKDSLNFVVQGGEGDGILDKGHPFLVV